MKICRVEYNSIRNHFFASCFNRSFSEVMKNKLSGNSSFLIIDSVFRRFNQHTIIFVHHRDTFFMVKRSIHQSSSCACFFVEGNLGRITRNQYTATTTRTKTIVLNTLHSSWGDLASLSRTTFSSLLLFIDFCFLF